MFIKYVNVEETTKAVEVKTEIIIGHGRTKRTIKGPFEICGDPKWLAEIAAQLLATISKEDGGWKQERGGYGWHQIVIRQDPRPMSDNPPIPWDSSY